MNTISTVQAITIDETFKPYSAAFAAIEKAGLDSHKVARYCESFLAADCSPETRKATKGGTATKSPVTVAWKSKANDGGKTTVKVAGATYELGDSAPARFVQVLNHLESLGSMFCPVDEIRIADSIIRAFQTAGLHAKSKEAKEASKSAPVNA